MPVRSFAPVHLAPDQGEFNNDQWIEVSNAMPVSGAGWVPLSQLTNKVTLTATTANLPLGSHVHPGHGAAGWMIYYGTGDKLWEIDPGSSFAEVDASGASYVADTDTGWQFCAFRNHEIAAAGHNQLAQIRLDGAGAFEDLINNNEPTPYFILQGWQEDNSGAPDYVDSTTELNSDFADDTIQPFPTGAGASDAQYFGMAVATTAFRLDVATAGAGTYGVTWKFWNGSAYVALSGVVAVNGLTGATITNGEDFKVAGAVVITYTFPTTWKENAVNGSRSLFFLKAERDGGTVTTNPVLNEADPVTGNWPPKPKFVANFRGRLAIANLENVGFANASGTNTDEYVLWVSADQNPRRFGVPDDPKHYGENSGFWYLDDEDGPITGLAGGADFGAAFKPRASYLVIYDGPLDLDFRQKGARVGCIYPNSMVWVGDRLFFWSSGGPAYMSLDDGVVLLTEGSLQRTLYDDTWIADTYPLTDRSVRHQLYASYSQVTSTVSWYYKSGENEPNVGLHYHLASGRFTTSNHDNHTNGSVTYAAKIFGVLANPYPEDTRWSGNHGQIFLCEGPVTATLAAFEANNDGSILWAHPLRWVSSYLDPPRREDGLPQEQIIKWVRPIYGVNFFAWATPLVGPRLTLELRTKRRSGQPLALRDHAEPTTSPRVVIAPVEDELGIIRTPDSLPAFYYQVVIEIGVQLAGEAVSKLMENVENLSEFDGFEYFYTVGGASP